MVTVHVCSKLKTSWKSVVLTNKVRQNSWYFVGVFNKTIIPLEVFGYEMIIANLMLRTSVVIYHIVSNAHSWNIIVNYITECLVLNSTCMLPSTSLSNTSATGVDSINCTKPNTIKKVFSWNPCWFKNITLSTTNLSNSMLSETMK